MADAPTPTPVPTPTPSLTPTPAPSLGNTNLETPEKPDAPSLANQDGPQPEPKPEPAKGSPEKYETFKAPEGLEFTEDSIAKATPLFKELGLSQEGAQKLMDLYASEVKSVAEGPVKYWQEMQEGWKKEITSDSKYGDGNGKLKPEVAKRIADLRDMLPPDIKSGFSEAMDLTGAGNNPAFIKAWDFLASKLTEGGHVAGNGPSKFGQQKPGAPSGPGAASLYPTLPSSQGG